MKTLISALNAKYVHSSLAVRCIKKYCAGFDVETKDYTINDSTDAIISDIFEKIPTLRRFRATYGMSKRCFTSANV